MSDLNQCTFAELYKSGLSLSEISKRTGTAKSTVRHHILKTAELRTNKDGIALAGKKGRMSRYGNRTFSDKAKENMREAAQRRAERDARGWRKNSHGAIEFTTGEHKGRSEHVIIMERRIGRRLKPDECVHHIDRNPSNNNDNNLALVTKSGHSRLHRFEDQLENKKRKRKYNGQFAEGWENE